MGEMTPFDCEVRMSSLDIAERAGKRHDHVMRDIRGMLAELYPDGDVPDFGGVYRGANGEDRPCFMLPEREFMILVSGYSVRIRAKVIDRWKELELEAQERIAAVLPKDFPSALRALADSVDRNHQLEQKVTEVETKAAELEHVVEVTAPKAAIFDKYLNADGLMTLQDLGRSLGQPPNKFIDRLKGPYLFEESGVLKPHARFAQMGLFKWTGRFVGEKLRGQTKATPKAVAYFARKLGKAA
ncbi:MAG: phage regulatory protein/antirepressor Ant [Sphingomonadaceae bacterium]|nr:phage regulatory protein/antirepressor Ant [Sphingomonadaceae bacterium]